MQMSREPLAKNACVLVGIAFFVAGCASASQSDKDAGPNASLSNDELLAMAVKNMKALKSYHMDFRGGAPSQDVQMTSDLSISADMQFDGNGSRVKARDESGNVSGGSNLMLDVGPGFDVLMPKDSYYESYDAGKTWLVPQTDTPAGFLMGMFGWWWNDLSAGKDSTAQYPTLMEILVTSPSLNDSDPRTEQVDGVHTRHMVADFSPDNREQAMGMLAGWAQDAKTISIWVSTDISPTVRQLRVEGQSTVAHNQVSAANQVAFSPDSKTMAVAHGHSQDWTVRLWDVSQLGNGGKPMVPKVLEGKDGNFSSVAFSPDGKHLAAGVYSGGGPSKVYLWDVTKLDADATKLTLQGSVSSVAFRHDGKMLAAGASDGVYLWEYPYMDKQPVVRRAQEHDIVYSVAFSPDGRMVAAGTLKTGVLLYDISQPDASPTVLPHEWVNEVAYSPDGRWLASTGVKLWDLQKPADNMVTLPGGEVGDETVAFSPDGKWLAASGQSVDVVLWEVSTLMANSGKASPLYKLQGGRLVYSVAFSPDGKYLAAASEDGQALLWPMAEIIKSATNTGTARGESTTPATPVVPAVTPIVVKADEQLTAAPFTLTWKWSKFNQDFGKVEAPAPETVKSP
jgi:WD40 repeat protein